MRHRTYKVLSWPEKPERTMLVPLDCNGCGREAMLEIGAEGPAMMAAIGLGIVFDTTGTNPPHRMPDSIKCRQCMREFQIGAPDVR